MEDGTPTADAQEIRCAQCSTTLGEGRERLTAGGGTFCRPCYNNLREQVRQAVEAQTQDINYPLAVIGAVLGGAVGVVAWWGFTVVSGIAFGLVAIVIGVAVAKGATILAGNKRSQGLQILSVIVSTIGFFYATYLVNRTFILRAAIEEGEALTLPLLPSPELFYEVVAVGFGIMDLVFLGIVVYEAWKIPAPPQLPD
jgi:hypothetical protein